MFIKITEKFIKRKKFRQLSRIPHHLVSVVKNCRKVFSMVQGIRWDAFRLLRIRGDRRRTCRGLYLMISGTTVASSRIDQKINESGYDRRQYTQH